MSLASTGTPESALIKFNSGTVTINGKEMVEISDITFDLKWTEKNFFVIGSVFKRDIKRTHFEAMVKFTSFSSSPTLQNLFYSASSTLGGDPIYQLFDGQQNAADFMVTVYTDDTKTKGFQYNLEKATIINASESLKTEDFATTDYEIACTKISYTRFVA